MGIFISKQVFISSKNIRFLSLPDLKINWRLYSNVLIREKEDLYNWPLACVTDDIKIERAHNFSYPVKINNKQPTRYFFPYLSIETSFSAVRHNCFFFQKRKKEEKRSDKVGNNETIANDSSDWLFFFFFLFIFNPPKSSEHLSHRIGNLSNFRIPFVSKLNFINR